MGEEEAEVAWGWWALGLLILAAVVLGVVLTRRRRTRADWAVGLTDAIAETTWLSHDLVPTLEGQGAAGRSGVWGIGRTRVLTLERTLEALSEQAPDAQTARRCAALSSDVQALRSVMDQAAAGDMGEDATTTALRRAQHQLDQAIVALQPSPGGGG